MKRTPKKSLSEPSLSVSQQRRLKRSIEAKVRHYERCLAELGRVSAEVYQAGIELFESEDALAQWLCEPAPALGRRYPLQVMATAKGRSEVARILRALDRGAYL
jgi:uncharacterized protein (DUF2384 family)